MRVDNIQEVLEYIKQMPFDYNVTSVQGEVVFLKIYLPEKPKNNTDNDNGGDNG
tara:strand:+ start:1785 stop:1946 length:162 start_codon:yes stop_codon:yes gene_type:complete